MTDSYLIGSLTATGAAIVGGGLVTLGHYVAARREPVITGERQLVTRWPEESKLYDQDLEDDLDRTQEFQPTQTDGT